MALLDWKDEYGVGVAELDEHHRRLFSIVNDLYQECLKTDHNNGWLGDKTRDLLTYADYHFSAEERYIADKGYVEMPGHLQMHETFKQRAAQFLQIENREELERSKELIVYLGSWLLHHVLEEDRKYVITD